MIDFIGNCSSYVDCQALINELSAKQGKIETGIRDDYDPNHPQVKDYLYLKNLAEVSGYNKAGSVRFEHFYPGLDFDQSIADNFGKFVNATPKMIWVSKIMPGYCAPWHWDIIEHENEYRKEGEVVRFHCHLSKPKPGHVFMIENKAFYMEEQGNTYQWNDLRAWHAGSNVGLEPKWLLTFTGVR